MADQAAIVQELYNRVATLPPDKAAIVTELAKRFNVPSAPTVSDVAAGARADALGRMQAQMDTISPAPDTTPSQGFWASLGSGLQSLNPVTIGENYVRRMNNPAQYDTPAVGSLADLAPVTPAIHAVDQATSGNFGGAAGTVLGAAAPLAIPFVAKGAARVSEAMPAARNAAADTLQASAEKNIATALNPTTKVNKALVRDKIAPGLVDRGVVATSLQDLQNQAQAQMEKHGATIDDIFDQHAEAGTKLPPAPILDALEAEKQNYTVAGVPINEAYVSRLDALQDQLQKVSDANGGEIPLADLRRIRQVQDEVVSQSKGGFALPPDAQSAVNASRVYGNAIRSTFADNVPELADANREFNFWANVDKVAGDSLLRKTGQRAPLTQKILEASGTALGAQLGGPMGAIVGKEAGSTLGRLQHSALWNTLSAQVKSRIGDLLAAGDEDGAITLAKRNGVFPSTAGTAKPIAAPGPAMAQSGSDGTVGVPVFDGGEASRGTNADPGGTPGLGGSNVARMGVAAGTPGGTSAPRGSALAGGSGDALRSADTVVSVPGKPGVAYAAKYAVRELNDVQPSHSGQTFLANPKYGVKNDRDYQSAVNQGKVISWSSPVEFNPKQVINDVDDATSGPPVVDQAGNVLGGNGRAMILQRVASGNPKGAAAYRALLNQKAPQFGIDPASFANMKRPVLVREIPESEFSKPGASKQNAITDFNQKGTAALTPAESAIADSRRVSAATLDDLAGRLDAKGAEATVADVLAGKQGGDVLQKLIDDGVVSPQERAALVKEGGELTPAGKDRISKLMLGRFFRDPAQLDAMAPEIRNRIERIAAPLAQVESKPDWNLTPDVQDALELIERARQLGNKNLDDFVRTAGLLSTRQYSPKAIALAKAIQGGKSADLTAGARQYAQDAAYAAKGSNTLMGDAPTPESSFAEAFPDVKASANALADSMPKPPKNVANSLAPKTPKK